MWLCGSPIGVSESAIQVRHGRNFLERLRFMFTPNGKREYVTRDQVFCVLLLLKNEKFLATFIPKNCPGQFLFAYFLM